MSRYNKSPMSAVGQNFEENLKEQLAEIDSATLQYSEQLLAENTPAVRKIVQNVLDEPISQETEKNSEAVFFEDLFYLLSQGQPFFEALSLIYQCVSLIGFFLNLFTGNWITGGGCSLFR